MQTRDSETDALKDTALIEREAKLFKQMEKAEKEHGPQIYHVVGKIPKKKERITVNGLTFIVTYSDFATGMFHAKIERPQLEP